MVFRAECGTDWTQSFWTVSHGVYAKDVSRRYYLASRSSSVRIHFYKSISISRLTRSKLVALDVESNVIRVRARNLIGHRLNTVEKQKGLAHSPDWPEE